MKPIAAALAGIKRPRSGSGGSGVAGGSGSTSTSTSAIAKRKRSGSLSKSGGLSGGGAGRDEEEESTATPEGLLMSKALSTFPPTEVTRFQSYRRTVFPSDAISEYVSHRLLHNEERRYVRRQGSRNLLAAQDIGVVARSGLAEAALLRCPYAAGSGGNDGVGAAVGDNVDDSGSSSGTPAVHVPPLRDVVAPETSQEVTVVVSNLAKCYAQRLASAARRVARAAGYSDDKPLLPQHLIEAQRHRSDAGLDPGFFMGTGGGGGGGASTMRWRCGVRTAPGATAANAAALGVVDGNKLRLDAALEGQRAYDEQLLAGDGDEEEQKEEGEGDTNNRMEVDGK